MLMVAFQIRTMQLRLHVRFLSTYSCRYQPNRPFYSGSNSTVKIRYSWFGTTACLASSEGFDPKRATFPQQPSTLRVLDWLNSVSR